MNNFTWSISNLELYELCGKKYYHQRILKDYKDKPNPITDYGKEAHKHFENRLVHNTTLPMDLGHHERVLKKLADAPGEGLGEQKLALTRNFERTGFFDADVWVRGVVDYTKFNNTHLIIVDHKFGKMKEGFDQLELMTAMLFAYKPDIETATAMYYWAKHKKITKINITRNDISAIWAKFLPRVERMENACKTTTFPAKPNYLCKSYCPVKECPHYGK